MALPCSRHWRMHSPLSALIDRYALCVQVAIAFAFMTAGRVPWILHADFGGESQREAERESRAIQDPRLGRLTVEADREHVEMLTRCAEESVAWTGGDGRRLRFGEGGAVVDAMVLGHHSVRSSSCLALGRWPCLQ